MEIGLRPYRTQEKDPKGTYFSKIPLDLFTLISSQLTIDKLDQLCSLTKRCNPNFWDDLFRAKFNKPPPENSQKWFKDRLKEFRRYLITNDPKIIKEMTQFGMINEFRYILGNHPELGSYEMMFAAAYAAEGGYREIINLILNSYGSKFDNGAYRHIYTYAAGGGHEDLMFFFQKRITDFSKKDYIEAMHEAAESGQLEILKQLFDTIGNSISDNDFENIFISAIGRGNENIVLWLIENYPNNADQLTKDAYVSAAETAAFNGNERGFDLALSLSEYLFTSEDYAAMLESAIVSANGTIIEKLISLGAGKSKTSYAKAMIQAARYDDRDFFEWMVYLGKDKIGKEDYQQALASTENKDIKRMITKYFL